MTSSRLPGKPLMSVNGISMLEILVARLSKSKFIENIIVATTTNSEDDAIINLCNKNGYKYFRGSEDNVLERVYSAANEFDTDVLVQITGDCPLIDVELVDQAIDIFLKGYPSTKFVSNTGPNISMPWGFDVQVYKVDELRFILESKNLSEKDKEHVSHRFYQDRYKAVYNPIILQYTHPLNRSELRVTLDYLEDFELIKQIVIDFGLDKIEDIRMFDIIQWLDNNPRIRDKSIQKHLNG